MNDMGKNALYFVTGVFFGGVSVVTYLFAPLPELSLLGFVSGLLVVATMQVRQHR